MVDPSAAKTAIANRTVKMTEGTRHRPQSRKRRMRGARMKPRQCRNYQWLEDLPTHVEKENDEGRDDEPARQVAEALASDRSRWSETRSLFILYCPFMHRSWKRVPTIEAYLSGGVTAAEPADLHSSHCRQPPEPFGHEARRRAPLAEWTFPCLMRQRARHRVGKKNYASR